jgi:hypothetical protein
MFLLMKEYISHIDSHFSNELKFLILLTQDEASQDALLPYKGKIDWDVFIDLCIKHRLISHINKQIHKFEDHFPSAIIQRIKQQKLDQTAKSLNYAGFVVRLSQLLKENNIQHCFFKGPLLSLELYNDEGFREFRDIDLLVNKEDVETARQIIESNDFTCIYPKNKLTNLQQRINYTISHHYHFKHREKNIDIELHWNITNPKSYYGKKTSEILADAEKIAISNTELPYISRIDNLVFLASHGSVHQWYRLFWLKDFSVILFLTKDEDLADAWKLSKKLKLENTFSQVCFLAHIFYKNPLPDFLKQTTIKRSLVYIPLKSIQVNDMKQLGVKGKIDYIFYRMSLKSSLKYYVELIYRLRTHLTDWEIIRIPDKLFFLYYVLRPFLLVYKFLGRKRS